MLLMRRLLLNASNTMRVVARVVRRRPGRDRRRPRRWPATARRVARDDGPHRPVDFFAPCRSGSTSRQSIEPFTGAHPYLAVVVGRDGIDGIAGEIAVSVVVLPGIVALVEGRAAMAQLAQPIADGIGARRRVAPNQTLSKPSGATAARYGATRPSVLSKLIHWWKAGRPGGRRRERRRTFRRGEPVQRRVERVGGDGVDLFRLPARRRA